MSDIQVTGKLAELLIAAREGGLTDSVLGTHYLRGFVFDKGLGLLVLLV